MSQISPTTPVLIGIAQYTERLDDLHYQALSPVAITAQAARLALQDCGGSSIGKMIDTIMTARTFEDSTPALAFPHGRSDNFPRSVCKRLDITPASAVWAMSGGDSPQKMVVEACERIAEGLSSAVLICGGEAMSTAGALIKAGKTVDWSETVDESVDDRGEGIDYVSHDELAHGLITPPLFHGLIENARRGRSQCAFEEWVSRMGELFAPFSQVASTNPYSCQPGVSYTASELATVGEHNRMIAHPYPQRLIARDKVNQSAALVVVSTATADVLNVPTERRIYLKGYAHARERAVIERPDIGEARSAGLTINAALSAANVSLDDIAFFDFYSCFPVAVANAIEAVGLAANDSRGLTLTGGLPYFGGPGNNYSMHAIVEVVDRLRKGQGRYGMVAANGGFLSKYAVGIYSTLAENFNHCDSAAVQAEVDALSSPTFNRSPAGEGRIETYTLSYDREGNAKSAVIVGRLNTTNERFIAMTPKGNREIAEALATCEPLGLSVSVVTDAHVNYFQLMNESE